MVERMEEKLEAAYVDQKRLFLIIFQRFIMILSEHLVKCDTDGRDYNTDWYRWTIGRLQQVFLVVSFPSYVPLSLNTLFKYENFLYSTTNKSKNTAALWRVSCSPPTWIPIFWMFSISL
jgi:hypothetical protein